MGASLRPRGELEQVTRTRGARTGTSIRREVAENTPLSTFGDQGGRLARCSFPPPLFTAG